MKHFLRVLLLLCWSGIVLADDVYIGLESSSQGVSIGLAPFATARKKAEESPVAQTMEEVVRYDLTFARAFRLVTNGPFLVTGTEKKELERWKSMGADVIIWARVALGGQGLRLETKFVDVVSGKPITGRVYQGSLANVRAMAHRFSDDIVQHFTGQRGIAQTKIAFVNNATGYKEVYMVDYDGENLRQITRDRSIALLPKWSPNGREIAYTSYKRKTPNLYIVDTATLESRTLARYPGLNTSAAWSPKNDGLVMTLSLDISPRLYLTDYNGKIIRPLTNYRGIETAACFSPSGREIVFTTDRPGTPQIYIMDRDGTNLRRMTTMKWCDSPVWSPQGNEIAFTGMQERRYDIWIMDITGGSLRPLTQGAGDNENPSWSPDGRFMVFSSNRNGKRELFIMSADGAYQHRLGPFPGNCLTPHWSP